MGLRFTRPSFDNKVNTIQLEGIIKPKIIICAAGIGSRLGLNIPKCLVEIDGQSLLERQLKILTSFQLDIAVVVGFQQDLVIEKTRQFTDVYTVYNERYSTTSVVESVKLGIDGFEGDVVIVDGDVLFNSSAFNPKWIEGNFICVTENFSQDPVFIHRQEGRVLGFSRIVGDCEWAGVCKVPSWYFMNSETDQFIYQVLERHLPIDSLLIDSVEIDTLEDLNKAVQWIRR